MLDRFRRSRPDASDTLKGLVAEYWSQYLAIHSQPAAGLLVRTRAASQLLALQGAIERALARPARGGPAGSFNPPRRSAGGFTPPSTPARDPMDAPVPVRKPAVDVPGIFSAPTDLNDDDNAAPDVAAMNAGEPREEDDQQ